MRAERSYPYPFVVVAERSSFELPDDAHPAGASRWEPALWDTFLGYACEAFQVERITDPKRRWRGSCLVDNLAASKRLLVGTDLRYPDPCLFVEGQVWERGGILRRYAVKREVNQGARRLVELCTFVRFTTLPIRSSNGVAGRYP